ncbi:YeeE/YedE family protein [Halofilum ochraceum]|uniref:YeeE/YedE family protein n=1 Tax=Halofilum ochraceum TaxID=1611323 RepID=UPI0008DB13D5|nr:YeeE/YedE thiosulfate transporter family protein [Halofilum ochraceum]
MAEFDWLSALAGGIMIGLAAMLLLAGSGRIAGISGILGGALERPAGDTLWRWLFLAGLIAGAAVHQWLEPGAVEARTGFPVWALLAAGLLVGIGTRMGSGCTSGHGVCGLARLSPRSGVATAVFVVVAMIVVWLLRHGPIAGVLP